MGTHADTWEYLGMYGDIQEHSGKCGCAQSEGHHLLEVLGVLGWSPVFSASPADGAGSPDWTNLCLTQSCQMAQAGAPGYLCQAGHISWGHLPPVEQVVAQHLPPPL